MTDMKIHITDLPSNRALQAMADDPEQTDVVREGCRATLARRRKLIEYWTGS